MYARVVLGATESVPFREVSSIKGCPYRGVPLYTHNAQSNLMLLFLNLLL